MCYAGTRNKECLSLGCDKEPLFSGQTPLDLYKGFIEAFADNFDYLFGKACCHLYYCQIQSWTVSE